MFFYSHHSIEMMTKYTLIYEYTILKTEFAIETPCNWISSSFLLDDHYDDSFPRFNRFTLWSFIIDLLEQEKKTCVKWTDRENLIFRVEDRDGLANEWGRRKGSVSMTWQKFARAMRYYYGKEILEKVMKELFSFPFIRKSD